MAYKDLQDTSKPWPDDKNYFELTITDLDPGSIYPVQLRWKYKDGTYGKDWSARYNLITEIEDVIGAPGITANGDTPGHISITWDGKTVGGLTIEDKVKQVDIYISGSPFDGTKPAISFDKAGTKLVSAPAGIYTIVAYAVTARGGLSTQTTIGSVEVQSEAAVIEPPTLPSGLSVASAPFAVSVNWNGAYSGGSFEGFKSIDIHVRGSDVGSTATSGFSTTTQVATLTVNSTTNRQNIGLDNLRQALSLASNTAAYTAPMFFYYIARNQNNELYSVGGTPTYTRINSSSVNPTQANFVDLANGVISIENLVAGNGQFSSWLRTGSAGGTRIELSAVNDFANGGYTVQKGLVAYSSGSTEVFNLDIDAGTLTITGGGKFTGDLEAGSGSSIFKSDANGIYLGSSTWAGAASTFRVSRSGVLNAASGTIGGLTLATDSISNSANTFKIGSTGQLLLGSESAGQQNLLITPTQIVHRNGSTATGKFTLDISTGSLSISGYATTTDLSNYATQAYVGTQVSSKSKIFKQSTTPTALAAGDVWIHEGDGNKLYVATAAGTGNWVASQDTAIAAAADAALNAKNIADSKLAESASVIANPVTRQITSINTNGVTVYSGANASSGARVTMNANGIAGWNAFGDETFAVDSATGSARFKGDITGASGTFSGNIQVVGNTATTTINSSTGIISINDSQAGGIYGGGISITDSVSSSTLGRSGLSWSRPSNTGAVYMDSSGIVNLKAGSAQSLAITADDGLNRSAYPIYLQGYVSILNAAYIGDSTSNEASIAEGAHMSNGRLVLRRNGLTPLFLHRTETSTGPVRAATFYIGGVAAGGINMYTNQAAVFVNPSDYRLKENIEDYINASEVIKKARLRKFNFKSNPQEEIIGFIAHEYAEINSKFVIGEKDAIDEEGNPVYQEMMMGAITPYLIGALKESILKIEQLEQRLDVLEG